MNELHLLVASKVDRDDYESQRTTFRGLSLCLCRNASSDREPVILIGEKNNCGMLLGNEWGLILGRSFSKIMCS